MELNRPFRAALFDLDGVVLNTEDQYLGFYTAIGREFLPDVPDFAQRIKGQTLTQIMQQWFGSDPDRQAELVRRLYAFEATMDYSYVKGVREYVESLRQKGILTAIVTSSDHAKMQTVRQARPELQTLFDRILTAEDYSESKPSPDGYLQAAQCLGVDSRDCVVFEDSLNGLRAARASGALVVALTTTNSRDVVAPLADVVIDDFL